MATRAEIKLRARRRADVEHSTHIGDDELNEYFQGSYGELYDLLVSAFQDYYITESSFAIASGASSFPVPADFYKLRGIDLQVGASTVPLAQFNFAERHAPSKNRGLTGSRVVYRLMGKDILMAPKESAPGTYTIWYIPRVPVVAADSDQVDGILDFEEYMVIDMAIKIAIKEESDVSALAMQKAAILKRIEDMSKDRDAGSPQTITDVTDARDYEDTFFPR